jgi:hypothetical protein
MRALGKMEAMTSRTSCAFCEFLLNSECMKAVPERISPR